MQKHASTPGQFQEVLDSLKQQDIFMSSEMENIKRLIAAERGLSVGDDSKSVIYVGPEIKSLLDETEQKLERKIKLNTLAQITFIYVALAVAIPVFVDFLTGDTSVSCFFTFVLLFRDVFMYVLLNIFKLYAGV